MQELVGNLSLSPFIHPTFANFLVKKPLLPGNKHVSIFLCIIWSIHPFSICIKEEWFWVYQIVDNLIRKSSWSHDYILTKISSKFALTLERVDYFFFFMRYDWIVKSFKIFKKIYFPGTAFCVWFSLLFYYLIFWFENNFSPLISTHVLCNSTLKLGLIGMANALIAQVFSTGKIYYHAATISSHVIKNKNKELYSIIT